MVQAEFAAATPPQADAMFAIPPMLEFPALREFVRGGGTMYKLIRADGGVGASPASRAEKRGKGVSAAPKSKRKKNACF